MELAKANGTVCPDEAEERIKKLREDLAKSHQDVENLRTSASVHTALTNASVEDGSKPIADQVAEHVEAVRAELEARHNERIKQVDERDPWKADKRHKSQSRQEID